MNFSLIRRFLNKISDDNIFALSAQFSYYIILGLFPFMLLIVIFLGYYSDVLVDILNSLQKILPKQIHTLLTNIVIQSTVNYKSSYFSVSIFILFWTASSGSISIIRGVNKAYNCEFKKNYLYMKIIGLFFTFSLTISFQLALIIIVLGKTLVNFLPTIISIPHSILSLIDFIRLFIPVVLLAIILSLVYKFIPHKKIKLKSVWIGALFATIGCIFSSMFFSIYINYKSDFYNNIYGNLSGIFILLLWVYMNSFIFLLGAEINGFLLSENIAFKKFFNIK